MDSSVVMNKYCFPEALGLIPSTHISWLINNNLSSEVAYFL